jgi:hypothetical protein
LTETVCSLALASVSSKGLCGGTVTQLFYLMSSPFDFMSWGGLCPIPVITFIRKRNGKTVTDWTQSFPQSHLQLLGAEWTLPIEWSRQSGKRRWRRDSMESQPG